MYKVTFNEMGKRQRSLLTTRDRSWKAHLSKQAPPPPLPEKKYIYE